MTVFRNKQRGGIWTYEFWRQGVRYRDYCRDPMTGEPVATKTAAKEIERAKIAEVEKRKPDAGRSDVPAGEYTLLQAGTAHIRRLVERGRDEAHIVNNKLYVAEVLQFFGPAKPFSELVQDEIDRYGTFARAQTRKVWLGGRRKRTDEDLIDPALWRDTGKPRSVRTANNYLRCLKTLIGRAAKVRDPSGQPAVDPSLEIEFERPPKRLPRPMADQEFYDRVATLPPWGREAAELSRTFGLRLDEALRLEVRHLDPSIRGLFFPGEETKSGHDERARVGAAGWRLLLRLARQARRRGTTFLVTWPGAAHVHLVLAGKPAPEAVWQPLRSLGTGWRKSAARAGIAVPRRFHDVRARAITDVARVQKAAAQGFARHQSAATTELYIRVADDEIAEAAAEALARRPAPKPAKRGGLRLVR